MTEQDWTNARLCMAQVAVPLEELVREVRLLRSEVGDLRRTVYESVDAVAAALERLEVARGS